MKLQISVGFSQNNLNIVDKANNERAFNIPLNSNIDCFAKNLGLLNKILNICELQLLSIYHLLSN
jgi:hypothetical protein